MSSKTLEQVLILTPASQASFMREKLLETIQLSVELVNNLSYLADMVPERTRLSALLRRAHMGHQCHLAALKDSLQEIYTAQRTQESLLTGNKPAE